MNFLKRLLLFFSISGLGLAVVFIFVEYYPYIFAKRVSGEFLRVERLELPVSLLTQPGAVINPQVFSYAIAMRDQSTKEIFTASSQDRQWAVVNQGQCGEAKLFPYPPWKLDRDGTYHNARLEKLFDCPKAQ
jgi:hypothetical protein